MKLGLLTTLGFAAGIALLALLAGPMLVGRVYVADDLGAFHLPMRAFYAEQLSRGEPFDWHPGMYCGFDATGEGQGGFYHPLHFVLYRLLPLSTAFNLECWLSYPAMLVGTVLFLRRLRLGMASAMFGAIVFTFGSFNFLHFVHPNAVAIVAHLPWLLWACDISFRSDRPMQRVLALAAIALLTGSQWLLGYPQFLLYSLLVEAGYVVMLWIRCRQVGHSNDSAPMGKFATSCSPAAGPQFLRRTVGWAFAVALGTLIGAVQILPTYNALQHSVRQSTTLEFGDRGSLDPINLVQLVGPYLFRSRVAGQNTHELALYVGAVPLILTVWASIYGLSTRRYRTVTLGAMVCAGLGLLWALGDFGPLSWLQVNVPIMNKFRLPCRAISIFQFGIAVLAAVGFLIVCRQSIAARHAKSDQDRPSAAALWIVLGLSVFAAIAAVVLWPAYVGDWSQIVLGPVLIVAAVLLAVLAIGGARWPLAAMIAFTAVDLGLYGSSYTILGQTESLERFVATINSPSEAPDSRVLLDPLADRQAAPGDGGQRVGNQILLSGWRRADGYAGLEPSRRLDYSQPKAQQVARVGWVLQPDGTWLARDTVPPRAWLVSRTMVSDDPRADLNKIDIEDTALVDKPLELPNSDLEEPNGQREATIRRDQPGEIAVETVSRRPSILLVSERFHPGWRATVDGQPAVLMRLNGDFFGTVVPSGRHRAEFQFLPASLKIGRILSCCGLGFLVAALAVGIWRSQGRNGHATTHP